MAPVVSPGYGSPDTTIGRVAQQGESITFAGPKVVWAVVPARPYWRVVRSTDAGKHWLDVTPPGAGTNGGLEITVFSASSAVIAYRAYEYDRNSTFAVTNDGGAEWTTGILPNAVAPGPDPIALTTARTYWAVLGNGVVVTSSDAGDNWSDVALPLPSVGNCQPTSVWFTTIGLGWITGLCHGVAALWQTSNGGADWQVEQLPAGVPYSKRAMVSPPQLATSGGIFTTVVTVGPSTDQITVLTAAGSSWTAVPPESLPAGRMLISFAGPLDGWVLDATSGKGALTLIYQTSNGGVNWTLRTTPIPADEVASLDLVAPKSASALAQDGKQTRIWTSANGAQTWSNSPLQVVNGPAPRANGVSP